MKLKTIATVIGATVAMMILSGTALAADVNANWDKHCLKCHGKDGKGNTRMGRQSGVKDYSDPKVVDAMKDDVAFKVIKEGLTEKGKEKMKGYGGELTDDEIKALIAHMRTFKK